MVLFIFHPMRLRTLNSHSICPKGKKTLSRESPVGGRPPDRKGPAALPTGSPLLRLGNRTRFFRLNKDLPFPIVARHAEFISDLSPGEQRPMTQACLSFISFCYCGTPRPVPAPSETHTSKTKMVADLFPETCSLAF